MGKSMFFDYDSLSVSLSLSLSLCVCVCVCVWTRDVPCTDVTELRTL